MTSLLKGVILECDRSMQTAHIETERDWVKLCFNDTLQASIIQAFVEGYPVWVQTEPYYGSAGTVYKVFSVEKVERLPND